MSSKRVISLSVLTMVFFMAACSEDSVRPGSTIEGVWGAEHMEVVAGADGVLLEYDCAHGAIDGMLVLDSDGQFDVAGTYTREGGPIDLNDPPEIFSARYQGRVLGNQLVVSVTLTNTGDVIGPYFLAQGVPGHLHKCL